MNKEQLRRDIKIYCADNGIGYAGFAIQAGVSYGSVYNFMVNEAHTPSAAIAKRLIEKLGKKPSDYIC